jgi:hypothetical protein
MASIARLWRRAPAWRLLLCVAIGSTALAAMFPPVLPHWVAMVPPTGGARFTPSADPKIADYETTEWPPLGQPRSGATPFAGRMLPLLQGGWHALVLARSPGPAPRQMELLGRIAGTKITGLLIATGPDAVAGGLPPAIVMAPCNTAGAIAAHSMPDVAADPLAHECWTLDSLEVSLPPGTSSPGHFVLPPLERLTAAGITIPTHMLAFRYSRSDQSGWIGAMLLIPPPGRSPAELRRLQIWGRAMAGLMHRGFDRDLPPGGVQQADPG